jgi:hypothetical protein
MSLERSIYSGHLLSMESVEHKKERLEPLFLVLSARTPLTVVAHILPGRRVVVHPTLGAIGCVPDTREPTLCLSTAEPAAADVHRTATVAVDAAKPHGEGRGSNY